MKKVIIKDSENDGFLYSDGGLPNTVYIGSIKFTHSNKEFYIMRHELRQDNKDNQEGYIFRPVGDLGSGANGFQDTKGNCIEAFIKMFHSTEVYEFTNYIEAFKYILSQ